MIIRGRYQLIGGLLPSVVGRPDSWQSLAGLDDWPLQEGDLIVMVRGDYPIAARYSTDPARRREYAARQNLFGLHAQAAREVTDDESMYTENAQQELASLRGHRDRFAIDVAERDEQLTAMNGRLADLQHNLEKAHAEVASLQRVNTAMRQALEDLRAQVRSNSMFVVRRETVDALTQILALVAVLETQPRVVEEEGR